MSDLLPCPFCGGKKLLATTNEHGGFCLTCENCDAIGPPSEYDPAQMREAWNTRADHVDALLKAEREKALREAVELCDNAPSKPNQAGQNKEVESAHWCAAMIRHLIEKGATNG